MKSQEDILQELRARRRQLIKEKNWLGALEVINTAVTLEPTFDRYYNQGVVLLQLQRVKEAIGSFNKSLELNPNFTKGKEALKKAQQKLQNEMVDQVQNANSSMYTAEEDKQTGNISRETLDMGKTSGNENAVEIKEYKNSKIPPLPESRNLAEDIPTERREKHILEEQLAEQNRETDEVVHQEKKYSNSKIPPLPEEGLRIHPIHETNVNIGVQNMTSDNVQAPVLENNDEKTLDFNLASSVSPIEQTMDFKESVVFTAGEKTICEDEPLVIAPNYEENAMTIDDVHSQISTKKYEANSDAMTIDDVHSQLAGNEQVVTKKYEASPDAMTIDDVHADLANSLNEQSGSEIMTIDDVHAQFEKPEEKKKTHTYFSDEFINPDDRGK